MSLNATPLRQLDPEIFAAIAGEFARQQNHIELIASENFTYPAVLEAQGSVLTNKYAEGYPAQRWYGGCEQVDKVEILAIDRAKRLFGAEHANVQPHSGSQANFAVYSAVLQPGDKVLGMNLSHGGHLTHGNPANFSGKLYQFCQYGVREDNGLIDYDQLAEVGAAREAQDDHGGCQRLLAHDRLRAHGRDRPQRRRVSLRRHRAYRRAGRRRDSSFAGAARRFCHHDHAQDPAGPAGRPRPLQGRPRQGARFRRLPRQPGRTAHARHRREGRVFRRMPQARIQGRTRRRSSGTPRHLPRPWLPGATRSSPAAPTTIFSSSTSAPTLPELTAKKAQETLDLANITCNKNTVPFETRSPFQASGLRLGTPAVTTRGMMEPDMDEIAGCIDSVLRAIGTRSRTRSLAAVKDRVIRLMARFPLPYKL